ncbi:MAG TPA: twin transmembrane helix small protein [Afifellaceae bacterium]|nr:twin transmembrane helix small protein [Afifellaceae bacterium]
METIVDIIVPISIAAVAVILAAGLWNMMRGGSPNLSQKLMRARVLAQFAAIVLMMGALWLFTR